VAELYLIRHVEVWEPAAEARARFAASVRALAGEARGPLALVTHGLVLSLYLGLSPEEWEALRLPDVRAVDVSRRTAGA
jgi:broad specificity phosphatase PhoE